MMAAHHVVRKCQFSSEQLELDYYFGVLPTRTSKEKLGDGGIIVNLCGGKLAPCVPFHSSYVRTWQRKILKEKKRTKNIFPFTISQCIAFDCLITKRKSTDFPFLLLPNSRSKLNSVSSVTNSFLFVWFFICWSARGHKGGLLDIPTQLWHFPQVLPRVV